MKELGFARKSESFLQIPIILIIKQHIFKAFALTIIFALGKIKR